MNDFIKDLEKLSENVNQNINEQDDNIDDSCKQDAEFITYLENLIRMKKDEISSLQLIKNSLEFSDTELINKNALSFLIRNEHNYLEGKYLDCYVNHKKTDNISVEEEYDVLGKSYDFDSRFYVVKEKFFCFILPPMIRKATRKKHMGVGKALTSSIISMLLEYEKLHGEIKKPEYPVIIISHNVSYDKKRWHVPDIDNLDVKVLIDALQGFLLEDDTLLDLQLYQIGQRKESTYTEVCICEVEDIIQVIQYLKSSNIEAEV